MFVCRIPLVCISASSPSFHFYPLREANWSRQLFISSFYFIKLIVLASDGENVSFPMKNKPFIYWFAIALSQFSSRLNSDLLSFTFLFPEQINVTFSQCGVYNCKSWVFIQCGHTWCCELLLLRLSQVCLICLLTMSNNG